MRARAHARLCFWVGPVREHVCPKPTLSTATPPDSFASRSCSFSFSYSDVVWPIVSRSNSHLGVTTLGYRLSSAVHATWLLLALAPGQVGPLREYSSGNTSTESTRKLGDIIAYIFTERFAFRMHRQHSRAHSQPQLFHSLRPKQGWANHGDSLLTFPPGQTR